MRDNARVWSETPLIGRRELLIAGLLPIVSPAQTPQRRRRIGYLALETHDSNSSTVQQRLLREALSRIGHEEGRNLAIEMRFAEGYGERLRPLAADLVRQQVELIIAFFTQAIVAARDATRTVPIVMVGALSPVELGLVQSLARPGTNVTGTTYYSPQTTGKLMEILKEAVPAARRVAVLLNPAVPGKQYYAPMYEAAAAKLGLRLQFFETPRPEDIAPALERVRSMRPDALFVVGDSVINPAVTLISAFAVQAGIPSVGTALTHARNGILMYYGPHFEEMIERVAFYVDRILAGAKPAELPVEQPTRYDLVINRKTAAALGIAMPAPLLGRANRFFD
jgi:putative ABC transport system substrate-binding protein